MRHTTRHCSNFANSSVARRPVAPLAFQKMRSAQIHENARLEASASNLARLGMPRLRFGRGVQPKPCCGTADSAAQAGRHAVRSTLVWSSLQAAQRALG